MKICDDLRQAVLQAAIQGKLTTQRQEDGDARDLLKQIAAEKAQLIKEGKIKKEKPLPEITEEEKPFDIPENWVWTRMGSIGETNIGLTYKPNDISTDGTIVLRSSNIQRERMDYTDVVKVTCAISQKNIANVGDILICVRNGSRKLVGKCAIIDKPNMAFGAFMAIYRSKFNAYVKYFLNSKFFRQDLDGVNTTTINQITQSMLKVQLIPLPPLAEQQRIVAKVDKLMAEIDELEKVENELVSLKEAFPGDMKAALLQAAMQGKLTTQRKEDGDARDLLKQIAAEKAKLIKEGKLKKEKPLAEITEDEKPFDIPDNWEWVRLNDLVIKNIKRGKSPTYSDDGYAFVFAQKCNVKTGGINLKLALKLKDEKLSKYPIEEYMLDADIVVNSTGTGTMGRVGIFRDADRINEAPIVPDSHVTIIRTNNLVTAIYLSYFLKSKSEYLEDSGDGSTNQKELKPFTIMNLVVPLPPLAEQKRLVTKLDKLLPLCDSLVES